MISEIHASYRIDFLYDEKGFLYGFSLNGNKYFYVRDQLLNIIGIVDINGDLIVQYNYDAYGNGMTVSGDTSIGNINPFRYKGYYYDSETNMYYCYSRYYMPQWCRWLNADSVEYLDPTNINGMNLYAYCYNNPVNYYDSNGCIPKLISYILDFTSECLEFIGKNKMNFSIDYFMKPLKVKDVEKLLKEQGLKMSPYKYVKNKSDEMLDIFECGHYMNKIGKKIGDVLTIIELGTIFVDNFTSGSETWVSEMLVDYAYMGAQALVGKICCCFIPGYGWIVAIGINIAADIIFEQTGWLDDLKKWVSNYDEEIRWALFGFGFI